MRRAVRELLVPELPSLVSLAGLATDAWTQDQEPWALTLTRILDNVRLQLARQVNDAELEELVRRRVASGIAVANGELNRRQLRVLLGIDILGSDSGLRALVEGFVAQNVALIRSLPERYFRDIEQLVMTNVRAGRRATVIEREIAERYPKSRRNASLIARDQTSKLNSELTRHRHQSLGITRYIWRTSLDDRVRPGHAALEGQQFRYARPPVVDARTGRRAHPGGDFQCRCTAEPVIPGLDEEQPRVGGVRGRSRRGS